MVRGLGPEGRGALRRSLTLERRAIAVVSGSESRYYNLARACPRCETSFGELDPRLFSFNSRYGACPSCRGMGFREEFDPDLVVADPTLSLNEGAIVPLSRKARRGDPRISPPMAAPGRSLLHKPRGLEPSGLEVER